MMTGRTVMLNTAFARFDQFEGLAPLSVRPDLDVALDLTVVRAQCPREMNI